MLIYLNGEIIDSTQAKIDPGDRGFLLGDGLFETMRAYRGNVIHLSKHWQRLMSAAKELQFDLEFSLHELAEIAKRLLLANQQAQADMGLRLTVTRGASSRGLIPSSNDKLTIMLTLFPLNPVIKQVFSAHIATCTRKNEYSPLARLKTLNYLENILARMEANHCQDDEALLLNTKGYLAEASAANIFIVRHDSLITPPITDGVLPGIMRSVVFELSNELGIACREESLRPEVVRQATEVFLTNAIIEVKPLVEVNKCPINHGKVGPITAKISHAYKSYVGERLDEKDLI